MCDQVHAWNKWEQETRQENFDCTREAMKDAPALEPSPAFPSAGIKYPKPLRDFACFVYLWAGSLFHQFSKSVTRTDYLTLRVGFLATHKLSKNYDFHKYIQRTMEADFKVVVGIRLTSTSSQLFSACLLCLIHPKSATLLPIHY
jgi:mlo protein